MVSSFRRSALETPKECEGKINHGLPAAGSLHYLSKSYERDNNRRNNSDRHTYDSIPRKVYLVSHPIKTESWGSKDSGHVGGDYWINHEKQHNNR